jgi:hypothetical protein
LYKDRATEKESHMLKSATTTLRKGVLCLLSFSLITGFSLHAQEGADALKKVVNSQKYVLVSPAESWVSPGGVVYEDGGTATFTDLPDDVKQQLFPATAAFPAVSTTRGFKLSLLLSGMFSLIGKGIGADLGHANSLDFKQVIAQGQRITYEQSKLLIANPKIKPDVVQWLTEKKRVYIVGAAFTTDSLSVTSTSSWNFGITLNGDQMKPCDSQKAQPDSKDKSDTGKTDTSKTSEKPEGADKKSSTSGGSKAGGTAPKKSPGSDSGKSGASDTQDSKDAKPTGPGGQAVFCTNRNDTLTMKTDKPLVFAVIIFPVKLNTAGEPEVQKVQVSTKSGRLSSVSSSVFSESEVENFPSAWKPQKWPSH